MATNFFNCPPKKNKITKIQSFKNIKQLWHSLYILLEQLKHYQIIVGTFIPYSAGKYQERTAKVYQNQKEK